MTPRAVGEPAGIDPRPEWLTIGHRAVGGTFVLVVSGDVDLRVAPSPRTVMNSTIDHSGPTPCRAFHQDEEVSSCVPINQAYFVTQ